MTKLLQVDKKKEKKKRKEKNLSCGCIQRKQVFLNIFVNTYKQKLFLKNPRYICYDRMCMCEL